jgi:sugar phosphate isomerase/epimerase
MTALPTLSLSTGTFRRDGFLAGIEWCSRLGMEAVEVWIQHSQQLHESTALRAEALAKAEACGVRMTSLHAWGCLAELADSAPLALDMGIDLIVVHCRREHLTDDFDTCVALAAKWRAWCADRGITLTVENAAGMWLEPFLQFFEAVPELNLTLDIKHAHKPELFGRTHMDYFNALYDRIRNFHILAKDPNGKLGDASLPGESVIDIPALARELAAREYAGLLTIECPLTDLPDDQLEAAYDGLPPAGPDETTMGRRLSRYAVDYYRNALAAVLAEGSDSGAPPQA